MRPSQLLLPVALLGLVAAAWLAFGLRDAKQAQAASVAPDRDASARLGTREALPPGLAPAAADAAARGSAGAPPAPPSAAADAREELGPSAAPDGSIWVEGRVLAPPGTPPDARLAVVARSPFAFAGRSGADGRAHRVAVGEDGRFRVAFAEYSRRGTLALESDWLLLPEPLALDLRRARGEVLLRPILGGYVEGRLRVRDAAPDRPGRFDGADVRLAQVGVRARDELRATVSDDGGFRLGPAPPGPDRRIDVHAPLYVDAQQDLVVVPGGVTRVDVVLDHGARISGVVLGADGAPVAGARVDARRYESAFASPWALTGEDGRFSFRGLRPGSFQLDASATGLAHASHGLGELAEGDVLEGIELRLAADVSAVAPVEEEPARGVRVHGLVTLRGEPVAGTPVGVASSSPDGDGAARTETDEQGRFELVVDAPGPRAFTVGELGHSVVLVVDVPPVDECDVQVELPGGRVRGRVLDETGAPQRGVEVQLGDGRRIAGWGGLDAAGLLQARTGPDGSFTIDRVEAGTYDLFVNASLLDAGPRHLQRAVLRAVAVPEDGTVDALEARLGPAGAVAGRVLVAKGAGAGALIHGEDADGRPLTALGAVALLMESDAFRIDRLAPGRIRLRAQLGEALGPWTEVEVVAGETARLDLRVAE